MLRHHYCFTVYRQGSGNPVSAMPPPHSKKETFWTLEMFLCHKQLTQSVWWKNESVHRANAHTGFFVSSHKRSHLSSHLLFCATTYLFPGMSFCSMLKVSHASHRLLTSSALWPCGASICSERALYSFGLPYMCVLYVCMHGSIYLCIHGCVSVWLQEAVLLCASVCLFCLIVELRPQQQS